MRAGRLVAVFGYSRRRTGRLHGICADRLAYAQENAQGARAVVFSGWSEAEPMRAAWTGHDVQLICDAQARSTADNAANVAALARELRAEELVVVTSPWHRTRARILVGAALRGSGIRFSVEAAEGPRPSASSASPSPKGWAARAAHPLAKPYLSETSSIRKLVARLKSVVARNCTRTVCPRQLAGRPTSAYSDRDGAVYCCFSRRASRSPSLAR